MSIDLLTHHLSSRLTRLVQGLFRMRTRRSGPGVLALVAGAALVLLLGPRGLAAQCNRDVAPVTANLGLDSSSADLRWSIGRPPISTLDYGNLLVHQVRVGAAHHRTDGRDRTWVAFVDGRYGPVARGTARDSDFAGSTELSRSLSEVSGGVGAFSAAVGWCSLSSETRQLIFWLGAQQKNQWLRMRNGVQVIPTDVPAGLLDRLDSRYSARWLGPWIGAEPAITFGSSRVDGRLTLHLSAFSAEGRWNLRPDMAQPRSFIQGAVAIGSEGRIRYLYTHREHLSLIVEARSSLHAANGGHDIMFYADGRQGRTGLDGVLWRENGLSVMIGRAF